MRRFRRSLTGLVLLASWWLIQVQPVEAVIVLGGDASGRNLTLAPDHLEDYAGLFGGFLGIPIGPHHFVTAWHVTMNPAGTGYAQLGDPGTLIYGNGTGDETVYYRVLVRGQQ